MGIAVDSHALRYDQPKCKKPDEREETNTEYFRLYKNVDLLNTEY